MTLKQHSDAKPGSGQTAAPIRLPAPAAALHGVLAAIYEAAPGVYLVGGAVRDLMLGRPLVDIDVAVAGDVASVSERIARRLEGHAFVLDIERRQMRIALPEGAPVAYVDVAPLDNGIGADLARRDFTVDAMAAAVLPDGGLDQLLDPHGGAADLKAHLLRLVAESALADDPLRLLRGVRLAAELGFEIETRTAEAMQRHASLITNTAAERQRDELMRIFETPSAGPSLRLMDDLGLLQPLFPELDPARGCEQPDVHWYDVFDHSMETVVALDEMLAADAAGKRADGQTGKGGRLSRIFSSRKTSERPWLRDGVRQGLDWFSLDDYLDGACGVTSRRALLKLAGLLHDVAKPETKTLQPDGRTRFFGHPEVGAEKAALICRRLRLGNRESAFVALLVDEHLRPTMLGTPHALPSHRAIYRFMRDLGEAAPACLLLALGDGASAAGPRLREDRWRGHVAYISYVLQMALTQEETIQREPRLLTGRDLLSTLSLEPGPTVGRLLDAIEESRAAGELSTPEEALEYARRLLAEGLPELVQDKASRQTPPDFDTQPLALWDTASGATSAAADASNTERKAK